MNRVWPVTAAVFAVAVAADLLRGADYAFPGYYAAFGFAGCVLIVLVSKWLGKHLLQRSENYYEASSPGRDDG